MKLGLGPRGGGTKEKKKEEEEKFPLCESIGHRPLRGRCPKRGKQFYHAKMLEAITPKYLQKLFQIAELDNGCGN